jgi:hypothetical protein
MLPADHVLPYHIIMILSLPAMSDFPDDKSMTKRGKKVHVHVICKGYTIATLSERV